MNTHNLSNEELSILAKQRVLKFAMVLGHPTRIEILTTLKREIRASVSMLSRDYEIESVGCVFYHCKQLMKAGAIDEVEARKVRGSIEHIYEVSTFGDRVLMIASVIGRVRG